ncbi:class II fructose-bisphosphate aldolase family protein [Parafrigoribacterium mesophilum]|uniref:class II fructose-bisphosphate aldolase n=1 Tax=Parafrigoribacterium mesophilum TaxID=433646 RepID=UPI0031FC6BD3
MTLALTRDLVAAAVREDSAVAAFNVITLEHAEAIVSGGETAGAALLLQLSENTVRFHDGNMVPILAACTELAKAASIPVAIHLDHFQDVALIDAGIAAASVTGVSSLMVDAAHLPYALNVERTAALSRVAHDIGLWIEAELGEVGGKDGAHAPGVRTDPDEAAEFVGDTGVDGLAVAVGSSHAMTAKTATLDIALIGRLAERVPVPLVLHGSSGVPDETIRQAVAAGMRKINIGTALGVAFTSAVRRRLDATTSSDPRIYLRDGRAAITETVARLCSVVSR